jgi:alpha-glucosidase
MWTGDTNSTWDTLALSIPVFQTLGLSGETFVGSDVGGFIGRGNGELLVRSYQVSFLAPFCRNHKVIDGYDQEPWRFGKYYEEIIRKYLKLRYRLLPFLYTTLAEAHTSGVPLFRPLVLNYQGDSNTLNLDDQFMIGADLLVAPILQPNQTSRMVYLPEGIWYDYWTGKKQTGGTMIRVDAPLETVPMFIRGGSIIPEGPEMNYVGEKPFDPITFYIHPDEKGSAYTTLYEDDGTSPAYKKGVYRRTEVSVSSTARGLEIAVRAPEGSYQPGARKLLFVAPFNGKIRAVTLDGKRLRAGGVGGKSLGYHSGKGSVGIAIDDDGQAHKILVK